MRNVESLERHIDQINLFVARGKGHATTRDFRETQVAQILISTTMSHISSAADAMEVYLPEYIAELRTP